MPERIPAGVRLWRIGHDQDRGDSVMDVIADSLAVLPPETLPG
jgi:hypothetical protein